MPTRNPIWLMEVFVCMWYQRTLQSIRTEARFNDFLVETVSCDFDVLFVSETWRDAKEESYTGGTGCTSVVALLIKELG